MPTYRVTVEDRGRQTDFIVNGKNPADAKRNLLRSSWMRNPPEVTDRALRYRANADPPPGERICAFCGSDRNVEVGHVDGYEENSDQNNLVWTCRSCNTIMGHVFAQNGLGRRTRQYNPANEGARSPGAWMKAVASVTGHGSGDMSVQDAVDMIKATPHSRRIKFSKELWTQRKKKYGRSGRSERDEVPF